MSLLIEASIRAALLAGAVAAVIYGLRIERARERHLAWCSVLVTMLLLPAFCALGLKATIRVLPHWNDASAGIASTPVDTGFRDSFTTPSMPGPRRSEPLPVPAAGTRPAPDLLWTAYLTIAGLLMIRLVYGATRAASIRDRARQETGFVSSPECACAVTIGWWRPVIVLPSTWTDWPERELDAVLAHERAHVRRRDPLVQGLAALNRCIFWFHPLAWWLERELAALAEEGCDAAAVASGHDSRRYAEYLIHQARAVGRAGARVALSGAPMGGGILAQRIRRLVDGQPEPALSRARATLGTTLCILAMVAFTACRLDRADKAMPGQASMHDRAQRQADSNRRYQEHQKTILDRAHSIDASEAQRLFVELQGRPQDPDIYWTLVRHYEFQANVRDLDALRLWYIEYQPVGKLWGGNIDPHIDQAGYEKGKALWLDNLKKPGIPADVYQRAADFLEGADKPLAERVLLAGRHAFPALPDTRRWTMALGRHYAQVLLGSAEPVTEYNVIRKIDSREAGSAYAHMVRTQLDASRDAGVLAETAQWLLAWGASGSLDRSASLQLARSYVDRALSLDPASDLTFSARTRLIGVEDSLRLKQLIKMPPAELAAASQGDRMILVLFQMREASMRQNFGDAESKARELLDLAARNRNDARYGQAIFDANIVMGKAALHRGERGAAGRYLLAAGQTPGSDRVRRGDFEMNLPRALVDLGQRHVVIEFFRRMAPKTSRAGQFRQWAAELSRGINPDLLPTFFAPGCSSDPC